MKTTVAKQPTSALDTGLRRYDGSREGRNKEPKIEMRLPWRLQPGAGLFIVVRGTI